MPENDEIRRREFLKHTTCCLAAGGLGLYPALALAAEVNGGHPLAPQPTHHEPKAKHLIVVFLTGGMSHIDTFDYKPKLRADHGMVVPSVDLRGTSKQPLMG